MLYTLSLWPSVRQWLVSSALLFGFSFALFGQCPTGAVSFTTQASLSQFSTTYPSCDTINGDLTISGVGITDVSTLSQIKVIRGTLKVLNTSVTSLNGLQQLDSIKTNLELNGNKRLKNLQGMNSLRIVGGNMLVQASDSLENFVGLTALVAVKGSITVTSNKSLRNFEGMNGMYGSGELFITNNVSLANFEGFDRLINTSSIIVDNCDALIDFTGLEQLQNIWNGLRVTNCDQLQSFDGLEGLRIINGSMFYVSANKNLERLNDFPVLDSIGKGLAVINNAKLTSLGAMSNWQNATDSLVLANNPLLAQLPTFSRVKGINHLKVELCRSLTSIVGFDSLRTNQRMEILKDSALMVISGFQQLKTSTQLFNIIDNPALESVTGFDSTFVSATVSQFPSIGFSISNNARLKSIAGFRGSGFGGNTGNMQINNNALLETIDGFECVRINGLSISNNPKLMTVVGFSKQSSIQSLTISNDSSLHTITGFGDVAAITFCSFEKLPNLIKLPLFSKLTTISTLTLSDLERLVDVSSFPILFQIGAFNLLRCNTLTNLSGFASLNVCTNISITANARLDHLDGMHNAVFSSMTVKRNPVLTRLTTFQKVINSATLLEISFCPLLGSLQGLEKLKASTNITLDSLPAIQNMMGFNGLTNVSNFFYIRQCGVRDMVGLDSLLNVGAFSWLPAGQGGLEISRNSQLVTLQGIARLTTFTYIWVEKNPLLQNLDGLQKLKNTLTTSNIAFLYIRENPALVRLTQFDSIHTFNGSIAIENCPALTSLDGMNEVRLIKHTFTLKQLPALTSIVALNKLKQVWSNTVINGTGLTNFDDLDSLDFTQDLLIEGNLQLQEIKGLERLVQVNNNFTIRNNPKLRLLANIDSLKVTQNIIIADNPMLAICSIKPVCDKIATTPAKVIISGNETGCADVPEVFFQCSNTYNLLSGKVYYDKQCDSTFNAATDYGVPNAIVRDAQGMPFSTTNQVGAFYKFLSANTQVSFGAPNMNSPFFISVTGDRTVTTNNVIASYPNQDFALCTDSSWYDICVSQTPCGLPRPGFSYTIHICVSNIGANVTAPVTLIWELAQSSADHITITNTDGGTLTNDTIVWDNLTLLPFESKCFDITLYTATTAPLGTIILSNVRAILPLNLTDRNPLNNTERRTQTVIGSYDPNNKVANRTIVPYLGSTGESMIDYIIQFQNTGTFPAEFVELYDTVPAYLDLRTLQMVAASHPYDLSFPAPNVLKWRFDNINLPDSLTSPLGSIGFVRFQVAATEGIDLYERINNAVSIYFDFNTPVLTDTSRVVVCPATTLTTASVTTKCGNSNGIASVGHGPGNDYTYLWSNGSTAPKISGVPPGIYTVTVSVGNAACDQVAYVEVLATPEPQLQLDSLHQVQCYGQNTGFISVGLTGGSAPFKYLWNTSDTTQDVQNLTAGNYHVVLIDRFGCRDSLHFTVTQPNQVQMTSSVVPNTDLAAPNGSIHLAVTGGTAPYQFDWSSGQTTDSIGGLSAGIYTVTVTDAHQCSAVQTFTILQSVSTNTLANANPYVRVSPNPADGHCTVTLAESVVLDNLTIAIFDEAGKRVYANSIASRVITVPTNSWPDGYYFIEIGGNLHLPATKLVVQHR